MTQCDTILKLLSSYIETTPDPDIRSQIQNHLSSCPACQKIVAHVELLTKRLQNLSSIKTSPHFDQQLRSRILANSKMAKPFIPVRQISYGLSGLAAVAGIYFITTTDIFKNENQPLTPQTNPKVSSTQPNANSYNQNPVIIQPVNNPPKALAADTVQRSPRPVDEENIRLIDKEKRK